LTRIASIDSVPYLNNVLEQDHRAIKRRINASQRLPLVLGSLAYNRRLRSDPYDPQRPSVLDGGGVCEGGSTARPHSSSVRSDELNFRLSTLIFGLAAKLQHIHFTYDTETILLSAFW
jgi:hypothetical protein